MIRATEARTISDSFSNEDINNAINSVRSRLEKDILEQASLGLYGKCYYFDDVSPSLIKTKQFSDLITEIRSYGYNVEYSSHKSCNTSYEFRTVLNVIW